MTLAPLFPDVSLGAPAALLLLLLLPVLGWIEAHARRPALRLSTTAALQGLPRPLPVRLRWLMPVLRYAACAALVLALARPQRHYVQDYIESEGIDIVLALDVSGSMLAEDLQPNRLEAAKDVALGFVDARPADRIGLVIFSGESFSQCPVTIDHRAVKENLRALRVGLLEDGTAIGDGLATAVDRLRTAGKSRVVVLMTDGVNNREHISPGTALQVAKTFGVRVYTVGIGTTGTAQFPEQTPFGVVKTQQAVQLDEPLLRRIAGATGGRYFRATDNASLAAIYNDIDRLEKVKVETTTETQTVELYAPLALAALICLTLELVLRYTLFRGLRAD